MATVHNITRKDSKARRRRGSTVQGFLFLVLQNKSPDFSYEVRKERCMLWQPKDDCQLAASDDEY